MTSVQRDRAPAHSGSFVLLTRDAFRDAVFKRDGHKCLVCDRAAVDAHHVIDRKLWPDGGYYLENGASVCEEHHLEAEATTLSCDRLRELAGITRFPLPEHLQHDQPYDKWANPILPNGMRMRGELFDDASVQKILAPVLALFTDRVKYPRTYHLPWSPGVTKDDRVLHDLGRFTGAGNGPARVVVTVKMDGENTTMYPDYLHARSTEYDPHPSRSWVKALHARVGPDIPKGWRVCGENLYAKHSIKYEHLSDYFQGYSIWNERNVCLSWDATELWLGLLGLKTTPVLYDGPWNERLIRSLYQERFRGDPCEGYVVRLYEGFHYREFRHCTAKYVRPNHVTTHGHWMRTIVEPNTVEP
ncbi:MAG: RNA ligase family protein [Polyangiales bacterium]